MQRRNKLFSGTKIPGFDSEKLPFKSSLVMPTVVTRFLSPEECAFIKKSGRELAEEKVATTGDGASKTSYTSRTSTQWLLYPGHPDTDWLFEKLEKKLVQLNNNYQFEIAGFFEGAQLYHYPIHGFLGWHMDIGLEYMSIRKLSMTIQLSEATDYDGGNLEIMGFEEPAARGLGDLTVFPSYLQHRVTEITRGTRECIVTWVHGMPFR